MSGTLPFTAPDLASTATPGLANSGMAESERQLNLVINTIPAMVWAATPDGKVDLLNQHFLDFVGLPLQSLTGTGFLQTFHPDDAPALMSTWHEVMRTRRSQEIEGRIRGWDGSYRWFLFRQNPLFDDAGKIIRWYGVILDIEDRKRAEIALHETQAALVASEQNLRLIIDSLPILAWGARPDGSSDFVNRGWAEYAGVAEDEILGWGFFNHYHPDDIPGMVEIWKDALENKEKMGLKGRIRRYDGEYRWFYFAGQKITDANGVVRWIGANIDIEDLQRAEETLRQNQDELARMARLTTLGELAVSIAHEVNQPLTAIVASAGTCLRWLGESQFNPVRARQAAERVVRDAHRAGDIITNIRALAGKSPIRMVEMDVQDAIRDVLTVLNGEFRRRGVEVRFDPAQASLPVLGDRTQLQQVILNLLMNAVEAMSESAPRQVTIISAADEVGFASISVHDTGCGLDKEVAPRIFEAFLSTKDGGLGMGLPICRSIVEAHGGTISITSNRPRGSIARFTVPVAPEVAP